MNALLSVADCVSGFVTCTLAAPALPAGVFARTCVALRNVTPVADVLPTRTVAPDTKLVPLIVIVVPPAVVPEVGDTEVTVGAGAT